MKKSIREKVMRMKKMAKTLASAALCAVMTITTVFGSATVKADTTQEQVIVYDVKSVTVVCPPDNSIVVMWSTPPAGDIENYTYNVYLNNRLMIKETPYTGTTLQYIPAGANVVTVKSVYKGVESYGFSKYALVRGETTVNFETTTQAQETTTAAEEVTTATPETTQSEIIPETTQTHTPPYLEVIGLVAESNEDNTIDIVWGQDAVRMEEGCTYDVFVNGVKVYDRVPCASYRVEDVDAGKAIVKVVMHTREYETAGVSKAVNVKGETEVTTEFNDSIIPTFVNLAEGKPVTVSSVENDSLAGQYAVDGDSNTRWSSAWNDGEWICVDLGKVRRLDAVVIDWEAAYASKYQIYTSLDGVEWGATNAGEANGAGEVVSRANVVARYVKVVCKTRGTQYGSSMYELKVFGY